MNSIKTAVIPAAGLGTRMRPFTNYVPKEMIPVGRIPAIINVLDELRTCGIKHIVLVSTINKDILNKCVKDYCSEFNLELDITYQLEPLGLGHAILQAKSYVKEKVFFIAYPDEIYSSNKFSEEIIKLYNESHGNVYNILGCKLMDNIDISSYGCITNFSMCDNYNYYIIKAEDIIEKPSKEVDKKVLMYCNNMLHPGLIGRMIISSNIFELLEHNDKGANGEIQFTDVIMKLDHKYNEDVFGLCIESMIYDCKRYDIGNIDGYHHMVKSCHSSLLLK